MFEEKIWGEFGERTICSRDYDLPPHWQELAVAAVFARCVVVAEPVLWPFMVMFLRKSPCASGERRLTMAGKVVELNDDNFKEQVSQGVTLVDFWAPWCGPCRTQTPIIEALAEKVDEGISVTKVNVDDAPQTAERYRVMSIPTLIILKDGEEVQRFVGVQKEGDLLSALKSH
mgnify:CR=1 FL=1